MSDVLRPIATEQPKRRRLRVVRDAALGLIEGDEDFRRILDVLPAAVYVTDAGGKILYYNEAAASLWGHRPELGTNEWCGSWRLQWPDGRPLPHDECPMAIALKEARPIRGLHAVAVRPDGTSLPFSSVRRHRQLGRGRQHAGRHHRPPADRAYPANTGATPGGAQQYREIDF